LYQDEDEFIVRAPLALQAWGQSAITSIDFSERSHSQMRTDLISSGPAHGFKAAADRLLCRQFAMAHTQLGGRDPGAMSIEDIVGKPLCLGKSVNSKRAGLGSNIFFEFRGVRLHSLKSLVAPNRPLSADELKAMEAKIRAEWSLVQDDPVQMDAWRARFEARRSQSRSKCSCHRGH